MFALAKSEGIGNRTVKAAKAALDVQSTKVKDRLVVELATQDKEARLTACEPLPCCLLTQEGSL
jgi:hypothetical protein